MIKKIICITLFLIQGDIFPSVCLKQQTARFNLLARKLWDANRKRYALVNSLYDECGTFRGSSEQEDLLFESSLLDRKINLDSLRNKISDRIGRCKSSKDTEILKRFLNCFENRVSRLEQDIAVVVKTFPTLPVNPYFFKNIL